MSVDPATSHRRKAYHRFCRFLIRNNCLKKPLQTALCPSLAQQDITLVHTMGTFGRVRVMAISFKNDCARNGQPLRLAMRDRSATTLRHGPRGSNAAGVAHRT